MIRSHTIMLDIDMSDLRKRRRLLRGVAYHFRRFQELLNLKVEFVFVYRTKHGMHIEGTVRGTLSDAEIVALQAIAGSDGTRETLNLHRVRCGAFEGTDLWNVLFDERTKEVQGRKPDVARRYYDPNLTDYLTQWIKHGREPKT